jgi:ABC-type dipeptide/oligopeptide/nickel transport system permease subunit
MKNFKSEPVKTCLTIAMGFVVVYLISKWNGALLISLIVGGIGMFSAYLAKQIDFLWMKLTWVLSLIIPNILLGAVFYLFLLPISVLAKIFGKKDPLLLRNSQSSTYVTSNKVFTKAHFEKPW